MNIQSALEAGDYQSLLSLDMPQEENPLHKAAREAAQAVYGNKVFLRGLVEFTNYCKQHCLYCGIRSHNTEAHRYRLTKEEILVCCHTGHDLGFRTFVLQGGEDDYYTDAKMVDIITTVKENFPDVAVTVSIGERSRESYQAMFDAGADRYLLRHETANATHYRQLHPENMSLASRKQCLYTLKDIGYQVGCGFMVGSPGQTLDHLVEDLLFIEELDPAMVGIGPFIPHHKTPFHDQPQGSLQVTLNAIAILRLMNPKLLLPATTSLGTAHPKGREMGILAGANVVMPNLSPLSTRKKYLLYDNKICLDDSPAHCRGCLDRKIKNIGYEIVVHRGDYVG